MRAVLGLALIFGGLLLAYAILSGKFPASGTPETANSAGSGTGLSSSSAGSGTGTGIIPSNTGLPTVTALAGNLPASGGIGL